MFKEFIKDVFNIYDFDIKASKMIKKSIEIYHRGGKINYWRSRKLYNKIRKNFGCNVPPEITIGKNLYIAHSHNIILGRTTIIGDDCKIYPNVIVAAALKGDEERWQNGERRHAKIGNNCILGANSIIVGPISIGDNVIIAAGAIVTKDVPSNSIVKNTNEITIRK